MKMQKCLICGTSYENKPWIDTCPICKSRIISREHQPWENYGDINYISYGGTLVKPSFSPEEILEDPNLKYYYDIFCLDTPFDLGEGDKVYRARLFSTINICDYEQYKEDLLFAIGQEDKMNIPWLELFDNPKLLAAEIAKCNFIDNAIVYHSQSYYIQNHYKQYEYTGFLTLYELYDWFAILGIDDESIITSLNEFIDYDDEIEEG